MRSMIKKIEFNNTNYDVDDFLKIFIFSSKYTVNRSNLFQGLILDILQKHCKSSIVKVMMVVVLVVMVVVVVVEVVVVVVFVVWY